MDNDYFINVFDTTMPNSWNGLNCPPEQSFLDPNQYLHFESPLCSTVSSSSGLSNDAFVLRQLMGKQGGIEIFPPINRVNFGNSLPLPSVSADPGFAERAAKFSCFGSRSFNGRTSPLGLNNAELSHRSGPSSLPRVSSSPVLKQAGSPNNEMALKMSKFSGSNVNEDSSVSGKIPSGETCSKTSNESNSRKRKSVSRGKLKEDESVLAKGIARVEEGNVKRSKRTESEKNENVGATMKEEQIEKPAETLKDYIHVRARRGQATDSHSLAERVRREKIGERMKLLQDLVPGCNKVTGKALMLDEIINYVQSLQRQVEFLSMKLASVNPDLDFNMDNLLDKDILQQNGTVPQQMFPQNLQQIQVGPVLGNLGIHLPLFDEILPQFSVLGEDDLHSIVQMGFGQMFPVSSKSNIQHES